MASSNWTSILGEAKFPVIGEACEFLEQDTRVEGLILHGSHSQGIADVYSDVDLIAVTPAAKLNSLREAVDKMLVDERNYLISMQTDRFPWFGKLSAFVFKASEYLTLEIGYVTSELLDSFFVEPNGVILKDQGGRIASRQEEAKADLESENAQILENSEFEVLNLVLKFQKAIVRGNFWNAYECCSISRRLLFLYQRLHIHGIESRFVGRADKRIEEELSDKQANMTSDFCPNYNQSSLERCFVGIVLCILDLDWLTSSWRTKTKITSLLK